MKSMGCIFNWWLCIDLTPFKQLWVSTHFSYGIHLVETLKVVVIAGSSVLSCQRQDILVYQPGSLFVDAITRWWGTPASDMGYQQ